MGVGCRYDCRYCTDFLHFKRAVMYPRYRKKLKLRIELGVGLFIYTYLRELSLIYFGTKHSLKGRSAYVEFAVITLSFYNKYIEIRSWNRKETRDS